MVTLAAGTAPAIHREALGELALDAGAVEPPEVGVGRCVVPELHAQGGQLRQVGALAGEGPGVDVEARDRVVIAVLLGDREQDTDRAVGLHRAVGQLGVLRGGRVVEGQHHRARAGRQVELPRDERRRRHRTEVVGVERLDLGAELRRRLVVGPLRHRDELVVHQDGYDAQLVGVHARWGDRWPGRGGRRRWRGRYRGERGERGGAVVPGDHSGTRAHGQGKDPQGRAQIPHRQVTCTHSPTPPD